MMAGAGAARATAGVVALALLLAPAAPRLEARQAIDAAALDTAARGLPKLHSLLVHARGALVFERYYHGARADRPANVKSASKSVIAALVGIAIADRRLHRVREPLAPYSPSLANDRDPRKRQITVEDLLTMRPGLESTSGRNYGRWVSSPNWVQFVLARPMLADPGASMDYSTGNTHLLSAILTRATGMSTRQFANTALARPLGFSLPPCRTDPPDAT